MLTTTRSVALERAVLLLLQRERGVKLTYFVRHVSQTNVGVWELNLYVYPSAGG